jgi:TonB family protein
MLKLINRAAFTTLAALAFLPVSSDVLAQSKLAKSNFQPPREAIESDRIKDGLVGPVRRVRTEIVKLASADGKLVEGKRSLLEVVAYDIRGNKTENQYFPVAGATLTGKEVYKYDDKGNISEMTLLNDDGSLVSKETYRYEFDFAGNWNKMTTSVAVVDGGRFAFEPTEVTYRSIMYYLDANMVKMAQPTAPSSAPSGASTNVAKVNPDANSQPATKPTGNEQTSAAQKSAPSLPPPSVVAKTNAGNAAELRNVAINSDANEPIMELGSEPPPSPATGPAPKPILKPISGGVLNGTALSLPAPAYPDTARRMRMDGTVTVEVVIDETGKVISAEAHSGPTTLREAATQAARKARFSPTTLSGQPVKVSGVINYKFSLSR